jgi:hypothetical protein
MMIVFEQSYRHIIALAYRDLDLSALSGLHLEVLSGQPSA